MDNSDHEKREFGVADLHHLFSEARLSRAGGEVVLSSRAVLPVIYFAGIGAVFALAAVGVVNIDSTTSFSPSSWSLAAITAAPGMLSFAAAAWMLVWKRECRIDVTAGGVLLRERRLRFFGVRWTEAAVSLDQLRLVVRPYQAWLHPRLVFGWLVELTAPDYTPLVVRRGAENRIRLAIEELGKTLDVAIERVRPIDLRPR